MRHLALFCLTLLGPALLSSGQMAAVNEVPDLSVQLLKQGNLDQDSGLAASPLYHNPFFNPANAYSPYSTSSQSYMNPNHANLVPFATNSNGASNAAASYDVVERNREYEVRKYRSSKWVCAQMTADINQDPFADWEVRFNSSEIAEASLMPQRSTQNYPAVWMANQILQYFKGSNSESSPVSSGLPPIFLTKYSPLSRNSLRPNLFALEMCLQLGPQFQNGQNQPPRPVNNNLYIKETLPMDVFVRTLPWNPLSESRWLKEKQRFQDLIGQRPDADSSGSFYTAKFAGSASASGVPRNLYEIWIPRNRTGSQNISFQGFYGGGNTVAAGQSYPFGANPALNQFGGGWSNGLNPGLGQNQNGLNPMSWNTYQAGQQTGTSWPWSSGPASFNPFSSGSVNPYQFGVNAYGQGQFAANPASQMIPNVFSFNQYWPSSNQGLPSYSPFATSSWGGQGSGNTQGSSYSGPSQWLFPGSPMDSTTSFWLSNPQSSGYPEFYNRQPATPQLPASSKSSYSSRIKSTDKVTTSENVPYEVLQKSRVA